MQRILCSHALLFIRHGKTQSEREEALSSLLKPQGTDRVNQEEVMFKRVEPNKVTDVPDWCAHTLTYKGAKERGILLELKMDSPAEEDEAVNDLIDQAAALGIQNTDAKAPRGRKAI